MIPFFYHIVGFYFLTVIRMYKIILGSIYYKFAELSSYWTIIKSEPYLIKSIHINLYQSKFIHVNLLTL
jgi:hypothetical protein